MQLTRNCNLLSVFCRIIIRGDLIAYNFVLFSIPPSTVKSCIENIKLRRVSSARINDDEFSINKCTSQRIITLTINGVVSSD